MMSDTEHAAVTEVPGAPAQPDAPVTMTAPWHNAPGTGAYAEPEVTTVRAYDGGGDTPLAAKVLEPPARPTPRGSRTARTKAAAKTGNGDGQEAAAAEQDVDEGQDDGAAAPAEDA